MKLGRRTHLLEPKDVLAALDEQNLIRMKCDGKGIARWRLR